jgi:hypothetical protein
MSPKRTESQLDKAFASAFESNAAFREWFLERLGLTSLRCSYVWGRANNPFGFIEYEVRDHETGLRSVVSKERETDILLVVKSSTGLTIGLHIENKISSPFTPQQAEMYLERARQWRGNPKYKNYEAWKIVLIAPRRYLEKHAGEAAKFDSVVPHEDIAAFVTDFG